MNQADSDVLKRKELYQELCDRFGNMRRFPTKIRLSASEREQPDFHVERIYEYDGLLMLRFSKLAPGKEEPREVACIFVDLHQREAQAGPSVNYFHGLHTLSVSESPNPKSSKASLLEELASVGTLEDGLANLGIPGHALGSPGSDREQRFSRFCNLSVSRILQLTHDYGYRFFAERQDRLLVRRAETSTSTPRKQQGVKVVSRSDLRSEKATFTVMVYKGKQVMISLAAYARNSLREAVDELFSESLCKELNRIYGEQEEKFSVLPQAGRLSGSQYHLPCRVSLSTRRRFKVMERRLTDRRREERMQISLRSGNQVEFTISDASDEVLKRVLSLQMQAELARTPLTQTAEEQRRSLVSKQSSREPNQQVRRKRRRALSRSVD
jgi:hypothetical protein